MKLVYDLNANINALDLQDGKRLYVDHNNRRFSHVHPLELPENEEGRGPIVNSRPGLLHSIADV